MIKKIVMMSAALALGMMLFSCSEGESGSSIGLALMGGSSGGDSSSDNYIIKNSDIESKYVVSLFNPITLAKLTDKYDKGNYYGNYIDVNRFFDDEEKSEEIFRDAKNNFDAGLRCLPESFGYGFNNMIYQLISGQTFTIELRINYPYREDPSSFIEYCNNNKDCIQLYDGERSYKVDSYALKGWDNRGAGYLENNVIILIEGRAPYYDQDSTWTVTYSVKNEYMNFSKTMEFNFFEDYNFKEFRYDESDEDNPYMKESNYFISLPYDIEGNQGRLYYKNGNIMFLDDAPSFYSERYGNIEGFDSEYALSNELYIGFATEDLTIKDFFDRFIEPAVYKKRDNWKNYFNNKEMNLCYFKRRGNQFELIEKTDFKKTFITIDGPYHFDEPSFVLYSNLKYKKDSTGYFFRYDTFEKDEYTEFQKKLKKLNMKFSTYSYYAVDSECSNKCLKAYEGIYRKDYRYVSDFYISFSDLNRFMYFLPLFMKGEERY